MKSWVGALLAAMLVVAGCAKREVSPAAGDAVAVKFATDWRAEAEQGGFWQALATGEYRKRGLTVTIVPGGPGVNVPQLVASGAVDFGVGSNSFIVMNLAQEGVPVKAVAAFMQKDPQVLIAHPSAGVAKLSDLKGHPILLADASINAFWVWLKSKYGLADSQVRKYSGNPAAFLADKRLVQQGYLTSEPYTIEKASGMKPVVMLLADEGYPGYAAMVLASDKTIQRRPNVVRAFVESSKAGWTSYLHGDARPGDALILKANPEMTEDLLAQARAKMVASGVVGDDPGAMTAARWTTFFGVASAQGVYPKTLDPRRAYDLQFVAGK